MSKHEDDDLPKVNADPREGEESNDEGLPSVNRKNKSNKVVSFIIIALMVLVGLIIIVKLNSAPKVKKVDESKNIVTNNLPNIDTTPPPPPGPAPSAAPASTATATVAPPPRGDASTNGAGRPGPAKGPDGKPIVHWTDRKLQGDLVIKSQGSQQRAGGNDTPGGRVPSYGAPGQAVAETDGGGFGGNSGGGSKDNLGSRLTGTATPSVQASLLRNRDFLLAKGSSLDCAMDSAIDTSLPGILTCTLTTDVYSDNNRSLLMERGTQLVGEQQGNVKQGQARVFALWTRAKTPKGVVINLNSPGGDSLGRSGLDGWVDNHFAERFGAAILMSFIQSALKYAVASQESGSPTTIIGDSADSGENVVGKILDNTIAIPPTILKNQGDHINIIVARDLDFSSVYELQEK